MKSKNWILLLLIALCLVLFLGYRTVDRIREDSEAPKIEMDAQLLEISVQAPRGSLLRGITAVDDVDGDVTDSLLVESISLVDRDGTISVSCAAFDSAGNVTKAQREVRYTDYESPKLTLSAPLAYTYGSNFDILTTVGATDVLDGDIQHRVRATALEETSIAELGTHDVQFKVTNSLGDTTTLVLPVEVYSPETYNAELTLTEYLVYLSVGTAFDPEDYLDEFLLLGETTDLTEGLPADFTLRTRGQVQTRVPGTYAVEYRVVYTDRHATNPDLNREYIGYSKLIVVVEG